MLDFRAPVALRVGQKASHLVGFGIALSPSCFAEVGFVFRLFGEDLCSCSDAEMRYMSDRAKPLAYSLIRLHELEPSGAGTSV